jgi:hypothetical protein
MELITTAILETLTVFNLFIVAFFAFAIWHNYRKGFQQGASWGADVTLVILEKDDIIRLEKDSGGELQIVAGSKGKKTHY